MKLVVKYPNLVELLEALDDWQAAVIKSVVDVEAMSDRPLPNNSVYKSIALAILG